MSSEKRENQYRVDPSFVSHSWVGEQKLARAVILNGLRDAAHGVQPAHRADALAWLLSDDTDPCSFLWWLAFLSDNPEDIADIIRRKVDLKKLRPRLLVDASGKDDIPDAGRITSETFEAVQNTALELNKLKALHRQERRFAQEKIAARLNSRSRRNRF